MTEQSSTQTEDQKQIDDMQDKDTAAAEANTTAAESAATSANANPQAKSSGKGFGIFAILLSLLALGGSGFTWYQMQVARVQENSSLVVGVKDIGAQVLRLGDSISRLQAEQANVVSKDQLSTRILESTSAFDLKVRDINDGQEDLFEAVAKINTDLQKKGANDFVVDEVSQLMKYANNSAVFAGDADSAIKALKLADIQLKELADPRFSVVRRKLNEEIALLSGIQQVDVNGLSARLNALAAKIPALPLENEPPATEFAVAEVADDTEELTWRTELRRMWHSLVNSVSIQRVDQPPKPLLAPKERYFLNQNLQLNLAKAELGLLQGRDEVYTRSIADAVTWLNEYFDLKDSEVQALLQQLNELKDTPISVELPSVAGSYDLLQSIKGGK